MARRKKASEILKRLLREWYSEDRALHEILPHLPGPVHVSGLLDKVMSRLISPDELQFLEIRENWTEIAGAQNAKVAQPVSFSNGTVYVEVSHSAWLRELSGGPKKIIIGNINRFCRKDFCRDIKFVPRGRAVS
ncbi:MAG: hypothetical protein A2017_13340 [Lentisphaerae bacterium GWF2_44_16]|nr:MAG: hypothetical protein A2017_13340 [Lentisphaerae bacterium GWF2_44_16]